MPPPPFNQIVTLGCMLLEDYVPKRLGIVGERRTEGEMLTDFAHWLDAKKPTVVTWNGRGFDMPVITSRALRHGVPMPWWFSDRNTRYRYSTDGHFDLMDFLADFGAAKNARLDVYAKLVGFPGQGGRRRLAGAADSCTPASSTRSTRTVFATSRRRRRSSCESSYSAEASTARAIASSRSACWRSSTTTRAFRR